MSQIGSDQEYLRNQQYKDASNLNARVQLHVRFGSSKNNWQQWVFDHFQLLAESRVLELGSGPGYLWLNNLKRIPVGWHVTLSDFSPGMLQQAQHNLQKSDHPFHFQQIDAQAIPCADASLDAVIANHMLYHVPDRAKAFAEIRRVLKPRGRLYAATNGREHMGKIHELVRRVDPDFPQEVEVLHSFKLENAEEQMAPFFSHIYLYPSDEDDLLVTEVEPLMDYMLSGFAIIRSEQNAAKVQALRDLIQQEITRDGAIRIRRVSGLFEAIA